MALIAGSCGMILTMAVHPSGHIAAAQLPDMIRKLILVHGFALSCVPVLFLGALGLSRRLETPNRLGVTGLVVYAFALIAVMNAAVADGLVTPSVLERIVASTGAQSAIDTWTLFSRYTFILNQAFAQVYVAAASVAVMVWSAAVWRSRRLALGLAIYGFILGVVTLAALFSGHLRLDVHGFGAVMLGQAIWFVVAGSGLWSGDAQAAATA
jgi:hypothetical protein